MALNPNVVVVAPGELITAAHINAIRSNLDRLDTTKLSLTGGNLTGMLQNSALIQSGNDVAVSQGSRLNPDGRIHSSTNGGVLIGSANINIGRGGAVGAANEPLVRFFRSASSSTPQETAIGSITINATVNGVQYNQTSDPRAKQRDGDITDALDRVAQLGRAAFRGHRLHADTGDPAGQQADLLSSHDIEDVAPYAVTGERDAVDDNGLPIYQQVSYGDLVPLLCAALADAAARIEALEQAQR